MKYLKLTFYSVALVSLPLILYVIAFQFIETLGFTYQVLAYHLIFFLVLVFLGINMSFDKVKRLNKEHIKITVYGFMAIYGIDKVVLMIFGDFGISATPSDKSLLFTNFISLVVLSPILEEVAFRGMLYERFKKESLKTLGMVCNLFTLDINTFQR